MELTIDRADTNYTYYCPNVLWDHQKDKGSAEGKGLDSSGAIPNGKQRRVNSGRVEQSYKQALRPDCVEKQSGASELHEGGLKAKAAAVDLVDDFLNFKSNHGTVAVPQCLASVEDVRNFLKFGVDFNWEGMTEDVMDLGEAQIEEMNFLLRFQVWSSVEWVNEVVGLVGGSNNKNSGSSRKELQLYRDSNFGELIPNVATVDLGCGSEAACIVPLKIAVERKMEEDVPLYLLPTGNKVNCDK
ncbi:hypothetical protein RIF29_03895 [Crotalaria pallida]|uniref:Uncharacterized protein n=1 Tax=Crotalaria pallida TaxID=3830 RepID=A0AAN9J2W0_CROPI